MRNALLIALLLIAAPLQLIQEEDFLETEEEENSVINRSSLARGYTSTLLESNHFHTSVNTIFFEQINQSGGIPNPGESKLFASGWACAMSANPPDACSLYAVSYTHLRAHET